MMNTVLPMFNDSTDAEKMHASLIAIRKRVLPCFRKFMLSYFAANYRGDFGLPLMDNAHICFGSNGEEKYVFVSMYPTLPYLRQTMTNARGAFFKKDETEGRIIAAKFPLFSIINHICITLAGSSANDLDYFDEMLEIFFHHNELKRYTLQTYTCSLNGLFTRPMLKKYWPSIKTNNVVVNSFAGYQKQTYWEMLEQNTTSKTSIHFGINVIQKFAKKKDFEKLRESVLAHPEIECLSFTCFYEKFNFRQFFKFIADPNLRIKDHTINLAFTFFSRTLTTLPKHIFYQEEKMNCILDDVNEFADNLRIVFVRQRAKEYCDTPLMYLQQFGFYQ